VTATIYHARPMTADLESARRDWEDGWRRLQEESRERAAADRLDRQVEAVTNELRRRVGGTYTLAELAETYAGSDRWARQAVAEQAPVPGWSRSLAFALDAAFHVYARGAVDFEP
jgi:hypothetical protein